MAGELRTPPRTTVLLDDDEDDAAAGQATAVADRLTDPAPLAHHTLAAGSPHTGGSLLPPKRSNRLFRTPPADPAANARVLPDEHAAYGHIYGRVHPGARR